MMTFNLRPLFGALTLAAACLPAAAVVTPFDLVGQAGAGLKPGNENPAVGGSGSGGEVGGGLSFDSDSGLLSMAIGWGSTNGFVDLSGAATGGHLHYPVAAVVGDPQSQNWGDKIVFDTMPGWNNSASGGSFIGTLALDASQQTNLFAGNLYINIHTALNSGGEIRGNLVAVPEPASALMLMLGLAGLGGLAWRRRG